MILMYLKRTMRSPKFFLSILGVFAVCMLRLTNGSLTAGDLVGDLDLLVNIDAFRKTIVIFASIPFVSNFANEFNNNISVSYVLRSSYKKYSWSQVIVCFIVAFITTLLGFILFLIVDSFRLPLYIPSNSAEIPPYGIFLSKGMIVAYLMLISVDFSLSCAMWSVTGLLISAIFPDSFIAFCSPFITSYLIERITLNFPDKFNLLYVALSRISILNNPFLSFLWVIFIFLLLTAIFGEIFVIISEKRIKNEIS